MAELPRVGFVGFGEAAWCFATGLSQSGVPQMRVYCNGLRNRPPYSDEFRQRVSAAGAKTVATLRELVEQSDVVFSAVLVASAEEVGQEIAVLMRPGQLLVDINASSPTCKRKIAEAVVARDALYVDVSLMGAVSIYKHKVQLYTSGPGAARFAELFTPLGLNIEVADDRAGTAATVKMLRSVVTKGMEALIVEAMTAAQRAGITDEAFRGICDPMDATRYSDFAVMCIVTDAIHSGRRAVEMEAAVDMLKDMGIEPVMSEATLKRLRLSADLGVREMYAGHPPKDYHEVLLQYDRVARERQAKVTNPIR